MPKERSDGAVRSVPVRRVHRMPVRRREHAVRTGVVFTGHTPRSMVPWTIQTIGWREQDKDTQPGTELRRAAGLEKFATRVLKAAANLRAWADENGWTLLEEPHPYVSRESMVEHNRPWLAVSARAIPTASGITSVDLNRLGP